MAEQSELPSIVEFSEDIASAEAPEPLPVGEYPATIQEAHVRISDKKGTKYGEVHFRIDPSAYPADYDEKNAPEGKLIVYRRVPLEDNKPSRHRLRKFCEAIGAPMGKNVDVSTWGGLSAIVGLDHDEYEGVKREEIRKVQAG